MSGAILGRLTKFAEPALKSVLPKALRFLGKPKLLKLADKVDGRLLKMGLRKYNVLGLKGDATFFGQGPASKGLKAFRGAVERQHAKYPLARSFHGG